RARGAAPTPFPNADGKAAVAVVPAPAHDAAPQAPAGHDAPGAAAQVQVGQPPESDDRPPEVARIFDQPGVLTPAGQLVLEPSMQFGYSSNDRVALVGYTVIPAILIGLIDVRQVKTTRLTAALAARYGLGGRFELEAKVPVACISSTTVSPETFTGSAQSTVFQTDGKAMGAVELTARSQLNQGGADKPFYVRWLRYKTRT